MAPETQAEREEPVWVPLWWDGWYYKAPDGRIYRPSRGETSLEALATRINALEARIRDLESERDNYHNQLMTCASALGREAGRNAVLEAALREIEAEAEGCEVGEQPNAYDLDALCDWVVEKLLLDHAKIAHDALTTPDADKEASE